MPRLRDPERGGLHLLALLGSLPLGGLLQSYHRYREHFAGFLQRRAG